MTKVRRMKPSLRGNLELIFYRQKSENPCRRSKPAPLPTPRRRSHPRQLRSQNPQCHYASREKQLPSLQHLIRKRTCSSRTSHPFLNKHTGIVYVKERSTFSRSLQEVPDSVNAVHSQVLRLGFDVMTSRGRHMVMEIIREQAPAVFCMFDHGPRKRYLPMVEFVASIARYQLKHGRYFIIENPQTSKIWHLN